MAKTKGALNKSTKERLSELRSRMALGQMDIEIREAMSLNPKQYDYLLQKHAETTGGKLSSTMFFHGYELRKAYQYAQLAKMVKMGMFGVEHPKYGHNQPNGKPYPKWEMPPNHANVVAAIRAMVALDRDRVEMGIRLGALDAAPTDLRVTIRSLEDMTDAELELEALTAARELAKVVGVGERKILELLASGEEFQMLDARLEGPEPEGGDSGWTSGLGGNGKQRGSLASAVPSLGPGAPIDPSTRSGSSTADAGGPAGEGQSGDETE